MPSAWEWWVGEVGEQRYDLGTAKSRDDAIRLGLRTVEIGEQFQIIEAQSSTAKKYDGADFVPRSEEHTSELQSLMRISYAVFCVKKKKTTDKNKVHD